MLDVSGVEARRNVLEETRQAAAAIRGYLVELTEGRERLEGNADMPPRP